MKVRKIIKGALVILLLFLILQPVESLAIDNWDIMKQKADAFIDTGKTEGDTLINDADLQNFALPIARILVVIATVTLTIVTMVLGIKYMMANPDDKAKLKQKFVGLVVSTIVIYGAQGIWAILYHFMTTVAH